MTNSSLWRNGCHRVQIQAGRDLIGSPAQAPHGKDLLETIPIVGILAE